MKARESFPYHGQVDGVVVRPDGTARISTVSSSPQGIGQKAAGLSLLPGAWVPKWISVPLDTCKAAIEGRIEWRVIADLIVLEFVGANKLIVRSSSPDEVLEARGMYDSEVTNCIAHDLVEVLQRIVMQVDVAHPESHVPNQPVCAPLVQVYLDRHILGHLSNEYRHAQRNVDFLYEIEEIDEHRSFYLLKEVGKPGSFRLDRPVSSVDARQCISVAPSRSSLLAGIEQMGKWIAHQKLRAHVEWVVDRGRLYVVQLDLDSCAPSIKPMSQYQSSCDSPVIQGLSFFTQIELQQQKYAHLKKTRSHHLLSRVGAFVPPIYVAEHLSELDWNEEKLPSQIAQDIALLCESPLILRFDVPSVNLDWTNLPTLGPSNNSDELSRKTHESIKKLLLRNIPLDQITLVAHHFIAARASAWSSASPDSDLVRVDATWGLPDGLQTFAHDTYIWNLKDSTLKPDVRYKDRFIDIQENGLWITRRAYPRLARESCCELPSIQEISRITYDVAKISSNPVRIMWFLDVIAGTGGKQESLMPWIVVEPDAESNESCVGLDFWLDQTEDSLDLNSLRKRAQLSRFRVISNFSSLDAFEKKSPAFDLGGKVILLKPDDTVVRDRSFLAAFANAVKPNNGQSWTILYEGSMLSHTPYQLRTLGVEIVPIWKKVRSSRRLISRKLVRDRIPEKIAQSGERAEVIKLSDDEYEYALRQKLIEEALEVAYADEYDDIVEELADVLAVVKALADSIDAPWEDVIDREWEKAKKRGGFEARLYLQASGYEPKTFTSSMKPGAVDIRKLKVKNGMGVRLPLVPPLHSDYALIQQNFAENGSKILIHYKDHHVEIRVVHEENMNRQLSLFDD
jgi:predicted house-cleaning noncanonical NTP pyrophosphatase (MazG superfamily)